MCTTFGDFPYIRTMKSFLRRILLRPSLWVAIITAISYWDLKALNGKWVYDDAGSVAKNIVVIGQVPWYDAFTRDFWGTSMKEVTSHKSFRPITTLSFKLNYVFNEHVLGRDPLHTFSYKLVNLILHVIVSALVTESSAFIFRGLDDANIVAQIITGLLFGLHPVHAEAVSNVTSRGEMWMSLFFLIAFLSYASSLRQQNRNSISSCIGIYIIPFLGMSLSLFSKEQGVTTLISLVVYDFVFHHGSVLEFYEQLFVKRQASAIAFVRRTLVLAFQTVGMAYFRYLLNGETSPDFIFDQILLVFPRIDSRVSSVLTGFIVYIFVT
jgi:protein O-mannosyl-transferase